LGEALLAASARFLECRSGKSGQPFYKPVDLDVAAFGWAAAAASRSKAAHALKLARSERQRRPYPSKADWCTGHNAAPQGAVKIKPFGIYFEQNGKRTAN
jgi:hypothetical protein